MISLFRRRSVSGASDAADILETEGTLDQESMFPESVRGRRAVGAYVEPPVPATEGAVLSS